MRRNAIAVAAVTLLLLAGCSSPKKATPITIATTAPTAVATMPTTVTVAPTSSPRDHAHDVVPEDPGISTTLTTVSEIERIPFNDVYQRMRVDNGVLAIGPDLNALDEPSTDNALEADIERLASEATIAMLTGDGRDKFFNTAWPRLPRPYADATIVASIVTTPDNENAMKLYRLVAVGWTAEVEGRIVQGVAGVEVKLADMTIKFVIN